MAKEFFIEVGGAKKLLRYKHTDREALEAMHKKSLMRLLREDFMPMDDDNKPTGGGFWRVQVDIIHRGLAHLGSAVSVQRVEQWMENAIENEPTGIMPMLVSAYSAILSSGALGMRFKIEEPEDEEGKAQETESSPPPTSDAT
jgi:hypothetical protein